MAAAEVDVQAYGGAQLSPQALGLGRGVCVYQNELLKGSTEALLLALLDGEAMYGYQIVREMERRSGGYFRFKEGTLYPALHRLEKAKLVVGSWADSATGQQRRYYAITAVGRRALEARHREWQSFSKAVSLVMEPGS